MILAKIKSDGLAHLSYILGDGDEAIVIDLRQDCEVYLDIAVREGMRITHIFETHRNEDVTIGSLDLARLSGAVILHGAAMAVDSKEMKAMGAYIKKFTTYLHQSRMMPSFKPMRLASANLVMASHRRRATT